MILQQDSQEQKLPYPTLRYLGHRLEAPFGPSFSNYSNRYPTKKPKAPTSIPDRDLTPSAPLVVTCDGEELAVPLAPASPDGLAPAPAPAVVMSVMVDPAAPVAEVPALSPPGEPVAVVIAVCDGALVATDGDWNVTGPNVLVEAEPAPAPEADLDAELPAAVVVVAWVLPPPLPLPDEDADWDWDWDWD